MVLNLQKTKILITGCAGFIGAALTERLLEAFCEIQILGIDNLNNYYDVSIKEERLETFIHHPQFQFVKGDIADKSTIDRIVSCFEPDIVINLAAQAGVRYSIDHPEDYIQSNIVGFFNILEACRHCNHLKHLVFASSSSVYGGNTKVPYSPDDKTDTPVSLYAATKKSNELMAYSYSKLYGIPATGLRFFTVYGPKGRPDMAYFSFANKLVKGESIPVFNYGKMFRDFTFIDDVVIGIVNVLRKTPDADENQTQFKIYNIGNNHPVALNTFIDILEDCLMKKGLISQRGKRELLPMQKGDVFQTYADVNEFEKQFDFKPHTSLEDGLNEFVSWYASYLCNRK